MAAPPLDTGVVQDTTDIVLANEVPETAVGTVGTVAGVAGADGTEALPAPTVLFAATVKVYAVPLVRPVTVQLVVDPFGVVQVCPPGEAVTV